MNCVTELLTEILPELDCHLSFPSLPVDAVRLSVQLHGAPPAASRPRPAGGGRPRSLRQQAAGPRRTAARIPLQGVSTPPYTSPRLLFRGSVPLHTPCPVSSRGQYPSVHLAPSPLQVVSAAVFYVKVLPDLRSLRSRLFRMDTSFFKKITAKTTK